MDLPLQIPAAKNEWTNFVVQLRNVPSPLAGSTWTLHIQSPPEIGAGNFRAYQILPVPVETNRAGYVRQTGLPVGAAELPRTLLPLSIQDGAIAMSSLRTTSHIFIWVDVHIPPEISAGDYSLSCSLQTDEKSGAISQIPISLHVYDFAIPDERHLTMVSRIDWSSLQRLYEDRFEAITPRLMNRGDPVYAAPLETLDQLVNLSEDNRVEAVIPRLQPTVKWPAGEPPQADWSDFDTVVAPWMSGEAFADRQPLAYWPLPAIDYLNNFDDRNRQAYWSEAASHFNANDWLNRSSAFLVSPPGAGADEAQAAKLSAEAQLILEAHPLLRVTVPLEDDQLHFADEQNPSMIDPHSADRVMAAAKGIVFAAPKLSWSADVSPPDHWLRTDLPGLVPYIGAGGDERDVRLWAWMAFLKRAGLIPWNDPLPQSNRSPKPAIPRRWSGSIPANGSAWMSRCRRCNSNGFAAPSRTMNISISPSSAACQPMRLCWPG